MHAHRVSVPGRGAHAEKSPDIFSLPSGTGWVVSRLSHQREQEVVSGVNAK